MKSTLAAITLLFFAVFTLSPSIASAEELTCKSKGEFKRCALPNAYRLHVSLYEELSHHKCEKGWSWGADSDGIWVDRKCKGRFHYTGEGGNHHDYQKSYSRHEHRAGSCPSGVTGNECDYYKDGYRAGKQDGQMSMSNVYQRHSDYYDTRFEPYFADGYNAGWNDYR